MSSQQEINLKFRDLIQKIELETGRDIQKTNEDKAPLEPGSLEKRWVSIMNQNKQRLNTHVETFRQLSIFDNL